MCGASVRAMRREQTLPYGTETRCIFLLVGWLVACLLACLLGRYLDSVYDLFCEAGSAQSTQSLKVREGEGGFYAHGSFAKSLKAAESTLSAALAQEEHLPMPCHAMPCCHAAMRIWCTTILWVQVLPSLKWSRFQRFVQMVFCICSGWLRAW